jgi:uncharacterized glyoxalase superfamily protein PhnB
MIEPIPPGYQNVTPWIVSTHAADLIAFITTVFDGTELSRLVNEDGSIGHAEVRIGDSVVMTFDVPPSSEDTRAFLRVYVEDADSVFGKAIAAGAVPVTEVTELFWGDRVGRIRDPWGNVWWIQQRLEELDEAEMGKRMADPRYIEAMQYVQDTLVRELSDDRTGPEA